MRSFPVLLPLLVACRDGAIPDETPDATCTVHADADHDGFGDPDVWLPGCAPPEGYVANADDCDDANGAVHPGALETCNDADDDCDGAIDKDAIDAALWYADGDGDGFGDDLDTFVGCVAAGSTATGGDCDDGDATVFPGAVEVCDALDDDCDGLIDDDDPTLAGGAPWYADLDGDSYGDPAPGAVIACEPPPDRVGDATDCDDANAAVHPTADEVCDGIDDDCDGLTDDDDGGVIATDRFYLDGDGDGFGAEFGWIYACEGQSGDVLNSDDCDDTDPTVGEALPSYADWDGDGYGEGAASYWCDPGTLFSYAGGDCDNGRADVYPGAPELCDDVDDNCDGLVDEDDPLLAPLLWYADSDGDSWGDPTAELAACEAPPGYVGDLGDCNDSDGAVHPGASEWCDAIDNDCDGVEDDHVATVDWYADGDGDGFGAGEPKTDCVMLSGYAARHGDCDDVNPSVWPGAPDVCGDDVDEDCDGDTQDCQIGVARAELTATGVDNRAGFGWSIGTGDVDADGTSDLLVGAPYLDSSRGQAYVVLGPATGAVLASDAELVVTTPDLDNLGGSFLVQDLDGDGIADLVVGAFGRDAAGAYVFLGPTDTSTDVTLSDALFTDGSSVSMAGAATAASDHDGDGATDLVVGAPYAGASTHGAVYVAPASITGTTDLTTDATYVYQGSRAHESLGASIASGGDYDGDGIADLVIGAPGFVDPSRVYVVRGGDAEGTYVIDTVAMATLVSRGGTDELGHDVASTDYDGDGYDDVVATAPGAESVTGFPTGMVYAFLGPLDPRRGSRDADVTWEGPEDVPNFGIALAVEGNTAGDSPVDVLIGTWGGYDAGPSTYLQIGPATGVVAAADLASFETAGDSGHLGAAVAFLPDWSGDGGSEIAMGAYDAIDAAGVRTGAAYVVFSEQLAVGVRRRRSVARPCGGGFRAETTRERVVPPELGQVVHEANEVPLCGDGFKTAERELSEPSSFFDLSEHWLDSPAACPVALARFLAGHPPRHALAGGNGRPDRCWCAPFLVSIASSALAAPVAPRRGLLPAWHRPQTSTAVGRDGRRDGARFERTRSTIGTRLPGPALGWSLRPQR